jgi:hypothetical protein
VIIVPLDIIVHQLAIVLTIQIATVQRGDVISNYVTLVGKVLDVMKVIFIRNLTTRTFLMYFSSFKAGDLKSS